MSGLLIQIAGSIPRRYCVEYPLQPPDPVMYESFPNVAVTVLPSATFDQMPFVSSNHSRVQEVPVMSGAVITGCTGVTAACGTGVAAAVAGDCVDVLVQPLIRTMRTSAAAQKTGNIFIYILWNQFRYINITVFRGKMTKNPSSGSGWKKGSPCDL
jgi:hypothetical protein